MKKNKITAVLGPTNTGKTHLAIETMLSFDSGIIGFPLRLLAREVYEKVIKKISLDKVALITGEEKIIPPNAKYFLCTVESMPIDKLVDFVGVDEIQMCADHERGHIFTDRLLNMRGEKLTMFKVSEKNQNENVDQNNYENKKSEIIQVINEGDNDPLETQDWIESLTAVIQKQGNQRAHYLIKELINKAYMEGANIPYTQNTPYINTIPVSEEKKSNGDQNIERRIRSFIRWNAAAMVVRANKKFPELGGHIGTFASAATLYDVGINHFWRAKNNKFGGDLVYFQGHSAPGMYARAFLEGRLNEKQLDSFRQEVKPGGLSSYPHPWLMPNFWQFPTVSMGLGPMMAIYQARFMKYLINRGLIKDEGRKVWAFLGDGEMDEPESLGAIGLASRENLDHMTHNLELLRLSSDYGHLGVVILLLLMLFCLQ